ncbi:MAG: hypothetical protein M3O70_12935 [Actinomycetota bacterium]|nr:hypothetical protein [Actinomycetota bacterium]
MRSGTGPTTAQRWSEEDWPHDLPDPARREHVAARPARDQDPGTPRGWLGTALNAGYPPILCNRFTRDAWGPAGAAIPDRLSGEPGRWKAVTLPAELAAQVGQSSVNLADPSTRRHVLPLWLETGPADLLAATVTFPQLRAEWPHLPISDLLREAWEDCYPGLGDDIT